ncbi:MAG: FAD-dependent oxidoreductase [Oscillospiraceae bacterium]|nr:FAD-dependent oxidoreductase [Oscillospiraceae bacterium]
MKYPHLFSPITLGNLTYRNRIFASPTGLPMVIPGEFLKRECIAFYEQRAKGGAASVSLGDCIVHTPTGLQHPYKPRLDDPYIISSLAAAARAISRHGAVAALELSHGGKFANNANFVTKTMSTGLPAYGPDEEMTPEGVLIREMPEELINTIVEAYGNAARLAKNMGFGMIVVHGGHGWLLHQFMSPKTNHRKDKFGGSLENRCRFALMALDAVRAAVGKSFPVEFRMSGAEFTPGGYDLEEGVEIAKLVSQKIDLLHVSAGVHDDPDSTVITHPSMFEEHGRNVFLAERIKKAVDCPVATIGALNDPEQMEEIIASGKADVVEMSRALTADPYLPLKAASGREDEIVRCIRCFLCLNQTTSTRNIRCAVNPVIGAELEHAYEPPKAAPGKRVLVVGGGPGGMEAALEAAKRGHDVTLCDDHDRLGGQMLCEEFVPFKREMYGYAGQKQRELEKAGVHIRCGTKVTRQWAEAFKPDILICAAGASPLKPPIPGIDLPNVKDIDDLRKEDNGIGKRVVIIGAGLVGCETAAHLLNLGHEVTILEMLDDYAVDATLWHKQALRQQIIGRADLRLGTRAVEITPEHITAEKDGVREIIPCDTVFCAAGLKPRVDVRNELRGITPYYYELGDCLKPGLLFHAISQGHFIGRDV